MTSRPITTIRSAALVAVLASAAPSAFGQLYQATGYSINHQFSFGIPSSWTHAEGRWFGHGWARSCNQWMDQNARVTPWGQSGQPAQAPNFAMYGADALLPGGTGVVNNGNPSPLSPPFPWNPPGSVNVPARFGSKIIPNVGTQYWPAGMMIEGVTASNGFVRGDGWSAVQISPYGGSNTLDGTIMTYGGYTENSIFYPVERGYGFSFTEVSANGIINPQYQPPMIWGNLFCISANASLPTPPWGGATFGSQPGSTPWQPPYLGRRIHDPIRYTVTDTITGQSISGTVISMHIDVGPGTTADLQSGVVSITGPDASLRIEMTDPRVSPQGTYELDIRNGMVVVSSATGIFAGQFPPPIGSMTPLAFAFPSFYSFNLDLNGFTMNPMSITMQVNSAGLEPIAELACAKIGLQPLPTTVCTGADATLFVGAYGTGSLNYQWRRFDGFSWLPLFDGLAPWGSTVSGANSATLTIAGIDLADAAQYDCIISDVCGTVTSQPANISVTVCAPPCYANCDGSTASPILTANDFGCFLNEFVMGTAYANCDGSTASPVLTANDFQCFINAFVSGCP